MAAWKGSVKRRDQMLPQIRSGLAFICEARDDWTGDQKQLEAWLRLDPKNVSALQRLAQCLFQQKNVDGALARLKEAAKSEPDMLTPEAMIGQWYARTGDRENAQKWMVAALKAAPKDAQTRLVAAQWAWETGQLDEAKQQVDAALRLEPKYLQAKILRGVVAMFQKDYKTAEVWFESAHQQAPKDFAASNNLALALVEQDDESKRSSALGLADVNARKYPRMGEALSTYAWVLDRLGRPEEAEKVMRDVVAAGSVTADTAYYWARILKDRGRAADAKQWLESALRSPAPFHHRDDAKALKDKLSEPAGEPLPK
jgi:tetratricopeptide (TPR) repeat protein